MANLADVLILSAFVLFISKSLYNVPMGIMAIIGFYYCLRSPALLWRHPVIRIYTVMFLCLWLPLLLSLPDAVNSARSAQTVSGYLRFLFIGIYVICSLQRPGALSRLHLGIFCITAFWCIDAVIQYLFQMDLFGYPYEPGHITGMFYPKNTIAHVTAAVSPLYFESIRAYSRRYRWLWLLLVPLFLVILLSGRRAAWIMLAVSISGYVYYLLKQTAFNRRLLMKLGLWGAVLIGAMGIVIATNKPLQSRIHVTMGLFSGNYEATDKATARRLPLWQTAITIFKDNWINGIGPRGFRYVYQQYSSADDFWHKDGSTHPHQLLLEVLAETGAIGFAGLLLFALVFYRFVKKGRLGMPLCPWWLSVLTVTFPINSLMAFYGSYWSSMIWWLLALTFAAAATHLQGQNEALSSCRQR